MGLILLIDDGIVIPEKSSRYIHPFFRCIKLYCLSHLCLWEYIQCRLAGMANWRTGGQIKGEHSEFFCGMIDTFFWGDWLSHWVWCLVFEGLVKEGVIGGAWEGECWEKGEGRSGISCLWFMEFIA